MENLTKEKSDLSIFELYLIHFRQELVNLGQLELHMGAPRCGYPMSHQWPLTSFCSFCVHLLRPSLALRRLESLQLGR